VKELLQEIMAAQATDSCSRDRLLLPYKWY